MTYSHNNIRNNIRMTTSSTKTIRLKQHQKQQQHQQQQHHGGHNRGGVGVGAVASTGGGKMTKTKPIPIATPSSVLATTTPKSSAGSLATTKPTTPPVTAHSNSIASSTNYFNHNQQHLNNHQLTKHALSFSPSYQDDDSGCFNSSINSISSDAASTCSSNSSLGSAGNGRGSGTYFGNRQQQQQRKQQNQQRQSPNNQLQRQSPSNQQQQSIGEVGEFFYENNNNRAQKNRESPRSPRQSPASILSDVMNPGNGGPRKQQRRSPLQFTANGGNGGGLGGKISPPLIPTALTHFAGSKCFDAPAPTALPKPPQHWFSGKCASEIKSAVINNSSAGACLRNVLLRGCLSTPGKSTSSTANIGHVVKSSKRNLLDEFDTHNLKLLLKVQ